MNRSFARTQARAFGLVSSLFMVFGLAGPSHADEKSAEVESLFADGKRLIEEGKPALACPKFLASYKLEPRIGTLLNLATCYEKNGQLASAWTRYVEAKPLTRAANQQERYDYANERAAALLPRLAHLTVIVPTAAEGMEIKRDGVLVEPATYGLEVPVDTGRYTVTATASGKRAWAGRVTVAKNGEKKLLHVPLLFSASQQEGTDASEVAPVDVGEDSSLPPADGRGGPSGRAVVGLVLAGAGVVGLGVGAGFGIAALGKKSDSNAYCGQNGAGANDCYGAGYDLRKSAAVNGNVSTALFAVGTAFVVSGLLLWLTAPKRNADVANEVARARLGWAF